MGCRYDTSSCPDIGSLSFPGHDGAGKVLSDIIRDQSRSKYPVPVMSAGGILTQPVRSHFIISVPHKQKVRVIKGNQPCLCLCFGFSQMIRILPFLLITLHFSQIGFTEDLTFMSILLSFDESIIDIACISSAAVRWVSPYNGTKRYV